MNSDSDSYLPNSEDYDLEQYNIDPPLAQIHRNGLKPNKYFESE